MVMDPPRKNYPPGSKAALLTVAFIFLLITFLSLKPVSAVSAGDEKSFSEMKKRLGSRPPTCVRKCSNCRPCTATLVISHDDRKGRSKSAAPAKSDHDLEDDESYYLQTWKCKCGNKLFEP